MEYVTKEEAIGMVHRVMGEYLLGQRVFYTDKDDILFDIDKSICAEIGKLPKCSILEGEFTVIPQTYKYAPSHTVDKSKCLYYDPDAGCCRKSEVPKSEWIPVSERLPEDRKRVLVCDRTTVYMANRHDDWWYFSPAEIGTIVKQSDISAWMPLPEPYKGEEA